MKSTFWNKLVLWAALILLLFFNFYTLIHAISGLSAGIVLFLFFLFTHRFLFDRHDRFLDYTALVLGFFILSLQIAFVLLLHSNVRYDAFWIVDEAVEMLDTHRISPVISNSYFSQVPNNYGLTIITYWFLSILKALGVPSIWYMRAIQFFHIVFLDLSVLFIYLFIQKNKGKAASVFFLLFCAVSPYLYVWTPYYYTSTTSMMFACGAVWLWHCICTASSVRKQCFLAAFMGFFCITGFKIRATSLIAYIAIFLYWSVFHKKGTLRKHMIPLCVFALSVILSFISWQGIVRHYAPFDTTDTAFPVTHFIMLGTHGTDGSFHMDDLNYTISLPTKEAKLKGTVSVIQERLAKNGLKGNVQLLLNKQLNCWMDGTDSFTYEHTLCTDFNRLHTYIMGSKSGYLAAYAQIFRFLQLFLVCIYCVTVLIRQKIDCSFLLALNLLGGMVFHLLWEASPFYSIPFTLFSYALAAESITQLDSFSILRSKATASVFFTGILLCFFLHSSYLLAQFHSYTQEEKIMTDFVVNQHMATVGEEGPPMKLGQIWTQTFEAETAFNLLDLYFEASDRENNTSVYDLTLSDEHGEIFYNDKLYGNKMGYDLFFEVQFEPIVPSGRTAYTISIEPLLQDKDNYIRFSSQDTSRVDLYPYGALAINGTPTGRDLSFRILNRHIGTAASKKEYGLFTILLLSLELFLIIKTFCLVYQKRRPVS